MRSKCWQGCFLLRTVREGSIPSLSPASGDLLTVFGIPWQAEIPSWCLLLFYSQVCTIWWAFRVTHNWRRASLVAQIVENLTTRWETWFQIQGWEDTLEKEMAANSSILSWRIPWTEEPGRLQSMSLQTFGHDWATSQGYVFSSCHVWMWELDYKESWAPKNWCFWTAVLEKTLESPLDHKEIQQVHPKGNQSWVFIGRTDVEAETPVLWPPDAKSWLIGKDPDAGKDWGQEEKQTTEDEVIGWHHWLNGHGFDWSPGVGDGQEGLMCYISQGHKESNTTERLNWTELSD